jgi:hypothetical protein
VCRLSDLQSVRPVKLRYFVERANSRQSRGFVDVLELRNRREGQGVRSFGQLGQRSLCGLRPCCPEWRHRRDIRTKIWDKKPLAGLKNTRYSTGCVYSFASEEGINMPNTEHEDLLRSARSLLDRFMFEGDELREDVANLHENR